MTDYRTLFVPGESPQCPPVNRDLIAAAEDVLGVVLPFPYLEVVRAFNGGALQRNTVYTDSPAPWAPASVRIPALMGIGGDHGIDSRYGSDYLIREWNYPEPAVVLWSDRDQAVILDYRECGPEGEPPVLWVDMARGDGERELVLAHDFQHFIECLVESPHR